MREGSKDTNPKDLVGTKKWRQFVTVPRQVLWEVGVAMLEGMLKYGRHNYRHSGVRASVYLDAAYGHLDQFCEGEDVDKDSGLSHVTKAIASLVVLRDAMMNDFWVDDRPPSIADLDGHRDRLQKLVEENFEKYGDVNPHHYTINDDRAYPERSIAKSREKYKGALYSELARFEDLKPGMHIRLTDMSDDTTFAPGTVLTVNTVEKDCVFCSPVKVYNGPEYFEKAELNPGPWGKKVFDDGWFHYA